MYATNTLVHLLIAAATHRSPPPCLQTVLPVVATAAKQLSVVVASKNAVKINAVAAALRQALPGVQHHIRGRRPACLPAWAAAAAVGYERPPFLAGSDTPG